MQTYSATTEGITVSVHPQYLSAHSDFIGRRLTFGYFVRIHNAGPEPVQLLRRYWLITEQDGRTEEVEGEGVVGRQPTIEPGQTHEYASYCVLQTFEGSMEGYYSMLKPATGEVMRVAIPRFTLRAAAN